MCFKKLRVGQSDCLYPVTVTCESILFIQFYQTDKPWQINIREPISPWMAEEPHEKLVVSVKWTKSSGMKWILWGGGQWVGAEVEMEAPDTRETHVKKAHRQWFNVTKFNYWSSDLGSDWRYLYFTWIWSSHSTLYFYSTTCQRDIFCMFISNYLITFVGKIFAYETHEVVQVVDLMNNFDSRSINFHTISWFQLH